ncbi:hypothetical protein SDRG_13657 [Saprolegnia diclina VS20]|uniref:WRKY19-like zinc finger domain-containing protein n=1 Tax=Saprolegnia diclina (strain VS20) TaxID=1156394 RepID=T0Q211_SAPDV|nr:hypothetical protein SDRG_13657 [Saprolegnia diclina VS20]EQC28581.1 hypothetical protein SDRG_13657 [Saprolegnia diclina VS20]|eukprot:XP_008617978.1 hypothetical protein SDRG_13657 [Saprolegnia diclina VS20]
MMATVSHGIPPLAELSPVGDDLLPAFDFDTIDNSESGKELHDDEMGFLCDVLFFNEPTTAPVDDFFDCPLDLLLAPDATDDEAKKICAIDGCHKRVRSRGLCKAHGGGRRCSVAGCIKSSQGRGLCIRHGGGRRCQEPGCSRGAQSSGRCKNHGGGIRCRAPGCTKSSQGAGFCRTHGGGKLCKHPGCKKGSQRKGYCATHCHTHAISRT